MNTTPGWSTKRAWKHVGLFLLLALVIAAAGAPWVKDPHRYGQGVGRFMLFLGAGVFGLSVLWQTGKRRLAVGLAVGGVALVGGLTAFLVSAAAPTQRPIAEKDRGPLERSGDVLRHPSLGFSFELPRVGYDDVTERGRETVSQTFAGRRDIAAWAWQESATGFMTMALLVNETWGGPEELSGFSNGFRSAIGAGGPVTTVEESSTWERAERGDLIVVKDPSGVFMAVRFRVAESYAVGLVVSGKDADSVKARVLTLIP